MNELFRKVDSKDIVEETYDENENKLDGFYQKDPPGKGHIHMIRMETRQMVNILKLNLLFQKMKYIIFS